MRSGGTSALRPSPRRHRLLLVCLLLGEVAGFAGRAYAVPAEAARPAAVAGQQAEQKQPSKQVQPGQPAEQGQQADSVRTLFSGALYFSPNNGDWIERSEYVAVGRFLRAAQAHPETEIRLTGWADTTGTAAFNRRISAKRAAAVGRYLVRKGIASARIRTEGRGEDATLPPDRARRVEMTAFVANGPSIGNAAATPHNTETSAASAREGGAKIPPPQNAEPSIAKDVTAPQSEPSEHTAPPISGDTHDTTIPAAPSSIAHTPASVAVGTGQETDSRQPQDFAPETATATSTEAAIPADTSASIPVSQPSALSGERNPDEGRYLGVKTNLAAWAGTILNAAVDVQVSDHFSVELPVLWCPWYVSDQHAIKTFTIQPEARYWLAKPGAGHFFGLHAHVGWFNVRWNRDRYQDTDRPLLGAGISYGYLLPFNEHWAGEFTLGAGYANMRYDTYYNIDNGARIDTRTKNYWGITRVGISVVYRFHLKK